MTEKDKLIAEITAIEPEIFRTEEMRCEYCDEGFYAFYRDYEDCEKAVYCKHCDGTGYRKPTTDDVLGILSNISTCPTLRHDEFGWHCSTGFIRLAKDTPNGEARCKQIYSSEHEEEGFSKIEASLRCLLAALNG